MTDLASVQQYFVDHLPTMQRLADNCFRNLDLDKRAEAVQNTLTLCWKFLYVLFQQGRLSHPESWNGVLWYAIRQTKCGRMVQGKMKSQDAYECRRRGRVRLQQWDLNELIGSKTAIVDQVIFRVDVRRLLSTLTPRQQELAYELAIGERVKDVAQKHGVTPGAISQFRTKFKQLHEKFFAE